MGKRKPKKRKNKLARPPKRSTVPTAPQWEIPEIPEMPEMPELPPEFYTPAQEGGEVYAGDLARNRRAENVADEEADADAVAEPPHKFDAPLVPFYTPHGEGPFGAVDPLLYRSIGYRKFRDEVTAIRESLPDSLELFATYDLAELKQRRWLTRYCIKKEQGQMPDWQQVILEKVGFNWVRGRKSVPKRARAAPRVDFEAAWTQAYQAVHAVCAGAPDATMAMVALLQADEVHYAWLRKQVMAIRNDKMKSGRRERLQALPFDFEAVLADRSFTQWRKRFRAYMAGELENAESWAGVQCRAKQAEKLLPWRIAVLNAVDFDWSIDFASTGSGWAGSSVNQVERMEARWRVKLEEYLALEALHGKPLSTQLAEAKPLRPWLSRMRQKYKKGNLRPELIAEFEARGFVFSGVDSRQQMLDRKWDRLFAKLEKFKKHFGHVRVPSSFHDDPELGIWVVRQRERMTHGDLKGEKLARFEAIGIERSRAHSQRKHAKVHISVWLKTFRQIRALLKKEHGGQMPPIGHFSEKHRAWFKRQRDKIRAGELEAWQLKELDAIGFDPDSLPEPPPQVDWGDRMERLRRFAEENGHTRVTRSCPDRKLGAFVERVRLRKRKGELSAEQLRELRELDFSFEPFREISPAWMRQYELLKDYHRAEGNCRVPRNYPPNQGLAEFVAQEKQRGRKGLLLAEHIRLLDALDFQWSGSRPVAKDC